VWRPLLQFLALGALLFAVDRLWWSAESPEPVVIDAARLVALRGELQRVLRREPTREELERAIAPEVDDELLYREALARGYAEDDPVIFRRLVQNLRFAGADEEREDLSLYREALEMGMHETDIVVRRRLVQRMRLDLEASALATEPDEAALRAVYERDLAEYRSPERTRLLQLYYAREHAERAAADLASLRAEGSPPGDATSRGDPFLLSAGQPPQTRRELADRFGSAFADGVFEAPPGRWSGPIASAYGVHLVWVHERTPERALSFEKVRERVRHAVLAERRRDALERGLAALREGVAVDVAWGAPAPS
jgi:hypothetical protein